MAVTFGFYDSVDSDRLYNAIDVGSMFSGVIKDGVFKLIEYQLETIATTGMVINVKSGKAWFDNTWTYNSSSLALTVGAADPTNPRIDAVIIEMDASTGVRANSIKIKAGTPAGSPEPPTMTHSGGINQYPLAYVSVAAGATEIVSGNITNNVGSYLCPWVLMPEAQGNGATVLEVEVFS